MSHLRWDFVFQRPQHLLTRCARERRVFFVEEPIVRRATAAPRRVTRRIRASPSRCRICRQASTAQTIGATQRGCSTSSDRGATRRRVRRSGTTRRWRCAFTHHLTPQRRRLRLHGRAVGVRRRARRSCATLEQRAASRSADVVFTGGQTPVRGQARTAPERARVPEQRRRRALRAGARRSSAEPPDQARDPAPAARLLRRDRRAAWTSSCSRGVAAARPDWQLVLVGPVAKIDPATLPRAANIHYLGAKAYAELPRVHRGLGRRAAAVRAQRGDALHQPDQDAGVPGRRQAGRLDVDPRRRPPVRRAAGWRASPTRRRRSSPPSRRRWPRTPRRARARGRRVPRADCRGTAPGRAMRRPDRAGRSQRAGSAPAHRPTPASSASPPLTRGGPVMFDYLVVGAGFAGSVLAERLAAQRRQEGADRRQAPAHRRQRLRPLRRRRHPGPQVRAAHLPHQLARGLRLPVAVHRVAAVPAPRARLGRRPAAADPDQPRHDQPAVRH